MEQLKEQILKEFEKKFAVIHHIHRGECAITDITGSKFEAHIDENGQVTSIGGLDSIKDFLSSAITTAYEKGVQDGIEKVRQTREDLKELYVKNDDLSLTK